MAVVHTLVQTKKIRINIHKLNMLLFASLTHAC
jgi:hypothetical protein